MKLSGVFMRRLYTFLLGLAVSSTLAGCSSLPAGSIKGGNVTVTLQPSNATLSTFGKQTFTPTVSGSSNTALNWQVNGVTAGSITTGTISTSGVYSAPHYISGSIIPSNSNLPVTVTITAISQANPAASGTATITLVPQGQVAQTGAMELGTSGSNIHAFTTSGNSITCCGGTLGSLVARNGTDYVLSNNHVLANSDSGSIGDAIIQPGLIDNPAPNTCTSTGTTTSANLSQFFTLEGNPPNPVDAAIAQIVSGKVDTSGNILLLGATADSNGVPVAGAPKAGSGEAPAVGLPVAKSGRTTGLTCSTIDSISDAFSVDYQKTCGGSTSFTVNYTNQISVAGGDFSNEGDSGALIVRQDTANAVALLFGGSDQDTVGSPIGDVLLALADSSNHVPTIVGGAAHQVIACSLPGPNEVEKTVPAVSATDEAMQAAVAARDANAGPLLGIRGVQGLSVGQSLDYSGQAAVLIFVSPGTTHSNLPVQLDGVRTRIVETSSEGARGILNAEEAQSLVSQQPVFGVTSLSAAELARAKAAHSLNVSAWMKQPGVQGFGITSSADSPGEAALMIFLIRGVAHNSIPAMIDGVRTRVRESSRFHAGLDGMRQAGGCTTHAPKSAEAGAAAKVSLKRANP
jgi:hypothetical protein